VCVYVCVYAYVYKLVPKMPREGPYTLVCGFIK